MAAGSTISLARRGLAEFVGTALLLAAIIGSGIAASRLSPDDVGLQLFENAAATAAALIAIILAVGPVSGAHLNPVITFVERASRKLSTEEAAVYVAAQLAGAAAGAVIANLMFELPAVDLSTTHRAGAGLWLAEVVATLGLVLVVSGFVRSDRKGAAPFAVGAYIGAAYSSPRPRVSRTLPSRSPGACRTRFAGIAPSSVAAFIAAQLVGGAIGYLLARSLYPEPAVSDAFVPQSDEGRASDRAQT